MPVSRKKYDKVLADLAAQQTLTRRAREDKNELIAKLGNSEQARRRAGSIINTLTSAGNILANASKQVQADGKIGDRREQISNLTDAREQWDEVVANAKL
jgi:Cdc6-like AAA superfamily ATPase